MDDEPGALYRARRCGDALARGRPAHLPDSHFPAVLTASARNICFRARTGGIGNSMSDYDHRDLDDRPEREDDLHAGLDSDEADEPEPLARTSDGEAGV